YPLNMDDLIGKVLGDPRWDGSTPLIGAITSGQAVIVQYLVDHGAKVDAKTKLGWTPLVVARGVFFANAKKEYPEAIRVIENGLIACGSFASGQRTEASAGHRNR